MNITADAVGRCTTGNGDAASVSASERNLTTGNVNSARRLYSAG
jgi:hypothetical protein